MEPLGPLERELARELERREAAGLRRTLPADEPTAVDFASNDTLGLARDPVVIGAARNALEQEGAGGRAARLLGGGGPSHRSAERAAAEWLGVEAALLVPSGFQANLAAIGSLVGRGDAVFSDARNHASLIDGMRLSRARVHVHRHLDLDELERMLAASAGARRRLVVTEGVFSMDGDAPDLARVAALCARHDAALLVDEAHAVGLLGPEGRGAVAAAGCEAACPILRVVTGGKALGVAGAFVAGSRVLVDHVLNHGRAFIFTTAPPPATAAALEAAIGRVRTMDAERAHVLGLARELARATGAPEPAGAIVRVPAAGPREAVALAAAVQAEGLDARAVRPPTVPEGESGLRVVVHAFNTREECEHFTRAVRAATGDLRTAASSRVTPTGGPLVVVGTDTGIGKTVVSALLLEAARREGPAAYWKPVQTGEDSDTATVEALTGAEPHELLAPGYALPLPASPHEAARDADARVEPEELERRLATELERAPERHLVVELAGGLLVPYRVAGYGGETETCTQADWLARAGLPLVLVARAGLGTLNHTLLTLEALRARHLEPRALFLVGPPHPSNRETLERLGGVPALFEVPRFDPLDRAALMDWLERHSLSFLFDA